jgi:hypothetical protein
VAEPEAENPSNTDERKTVDCPRCNAETTEAELTYSGCPGCREPDDEQFVREPLLMRLGLDGLADKDDAQGGEPSSPVVEDGERPVMHHYVHGLLDPITYSAPHADDCPGCEIESLRSLLRVAEQDRDTNAYWRAQNMRERNDWHRQWMSACEDIALVQAEAQVAIRELTQQNEKLMALLRIVEQEAKYRTENEGGGSAAGSGGKRNV